MSNNVLCPAITMEELSSQISYDKDSSTIDTRFRKDTGYGKCKKHGRGISVRLKLNTVEHEKSQSQIQLGRMPDTFLRHQTDMEDK